MAELPDPLTPIDCDLRDFQYMPLDVLRLRDSGAAALPHPEAFRACVLAWCASWHQVPAASLPDDDVALSVLLGYGRTVATWSKVRKGGGLHGWIKCSDGRLYHPVVAEKANEAWDIKSNGRRRAATKWAVGDKAAQRETRAARLSAVRGKGKHTSAEWDALLTVCGRRCTACNATEKLVKDHITPIYQGGSDGIENLQPLCGRCNSSKGPDSTDHRPSDWRAKMNAFHQAFNEGLAGVPEVPANASTEALNACKGEERKGEDKEEAADAGAKAEALPMMPARDDPPHRWMHLAEKREVDREGVTRPVVADSYLDISAELVCEAAGINSAHWRGDWRPLISWLKDGLDPDRDIIPVIKRMANRSGYQPPRSLAYFDQAIRSDGVRSRA